MSVRIKDLATTATSPANDDYIAIDGATNGTRKIPASEIGGGGTSDDITNESTVSGATVTDALSSLNDQIANLEGGAPTPAATVSAMVDTTKIYLYTGSETGYNAGHWYYHSNGAWVDGGAYGEAASMSAGVKAALLACFQKVAWIDDQGQTYYENLYNELYPPANLVSITAVYTQSGTVYSTATLNDLRADLVVNANYDDGSSKTITDYVLSGTLSSTVSVITVSALGKETTFTVNVTEPIDYNRNPLDGATWRSGTSYNGTTGEEQSMANNHSTTKFTAQDCMYLLKNTDSNNTWVQMLAWDANGNFLGTMRNDSEALIKLNGNGQYAIVCANSSGNFDSTTISLMPKDNTSSTVPTLEINLNDYISDIKYTNASYYEVNISSALTNAGFTNANHKTTVKDCNVQMPITPQSINQAFKDQDGLHAWFYTWGILLFGIKGVPYKDINALSAYLGSNNVTLKFN